MILMMMLDFGVWGMLLNIYDLGIVLDLDSLEDDVWF